MDIAVVLAILAMAFIQFVSGKIAPEIIAIGQRLLPGRKSTQEPEEVPVTRNLIKRYEFEDRIFEVWAGDEFKEEPRSIGSLELDEKYAITPLAVIRDGKDLRFPDRELEIQPRDMLLVQGRQQDVDRLTEDHDSPTFMGTPQSQKKYPLSTGELAEAVVPPRSPAIGKTPRELRLADKYGMIVTALYRDDQPRRRHALDETLEAGDAILVYGPRSQMREFNPKKDLLIYFKPSEYQAGDYLRFGLGFNIFALIIILVMVPLIWPL